MELKIKRWLGNEFLSSSGLTEEFALFAREFRKTIFNSLPAGAELAAWSRGHFYVSGFVKRNGKFVYFSISDVRHFADAWYEQILIRTAKDEKDYTGGSNGFTDLPNFKEAVEKLLN